MQLPPPQIAEALLRLSGDLKNVSLDERRGSH